MSMHLLACAAPAFCRMGLRKTLYAASFKNPKNTRRCHMVRSSHHKQRTPMSAKCAALYVRVSTDAQTVENQIRELRQVAARRGWDVVEVYSDAGISGAKGRNGRPGLDALLKDASRRKFDVAM